MPIAFFWFMVQGIAMMVALWLGMRMGRGRYCRLWFAVGLALLAFWGCLHYNPSVAVQLIPIGVMYYIEGTGAVPAFMLIVGIAYGSSKLARQRRLTVLAMMLGIVFFLQGGLWMLQTTPQQIFANTMVTDDATMVMQSQDFSCVPAACATALREIGLEATESEMAVLTQTRPGTGATLIRAAQALRRKLEPEGIKVHIIQPTYEQLRHLPVPILTPLQLEVSKRHMVTILNIHRNGVLIADPINGKVYMQRRDFEAAFIGQIIALER